MVENGFYNFMNWFDERAWYPLGRIVGGTVSYFKDIIKPASSGLSRFDGHFGSDSLRSFTDQLSRSY